MRPAVAIEEIEQMRRQQGIEDAELRREIRGLRVGDRVKLTFLPGATSAAGETLLVRITSINGRAFRGKLVEGPSSSGLAPLRAGSHVAFTSAQIHSVARAPAGHELRKRNVRLGPAS